MQSVTQWHLKCEKAVQVTLVVLLQTWQTDHSDHFIPTIPAAFCLVLCRVNPALLTCCSVYRELHLNRHV